MRETQLPMAGMSVAMMLFVVVERLPGCANLSIDARRNA